MEEITRTILFAEAASAFEDFIESGRMSELADPADHYSADARVTILAKDYIRALRLRAVVAREIDNAMSPFDALIAHPESLTRAPGGQQTALGTSISSGSNRSGVAHSSITPSSCSTH